VAVALIVAAGRGERLGANRPKAFVELAGRPLLSYSLDVLRCVPAIERIVVALPPGIAAPPDTVGVVGGRVRSDSVRRALDAAGPGDPVLVHDAARPLLDRDLVERVLAAVHGADAAIAATPVTDTVKRASPGGIVERTLERATLWAVQTPQVFRRAALEQALDVPEELLAQATDDAWLVERNGGSVRIVPAPRENLKVTTPLDLRVAELLLAASQPGPPRAGGSGGPLPPVGPDSEPA
jgi:2-C-methyl-D-erythritol 4-phosphate cytidylyltransferase